jgi:hypothetical protein
MGFFSSFTKGLLPAPLQGVIDSQKGLKPAPLQGVIDSQKEFLPEPSEVEIAKEAFRKFGHNPEAPWVHPESRQPILPDSFGYISWLPPDLAAQSLNILISSSGSSQTLDNEFVGSTQPRSSTYSFHGNHEEDIPHKRVELSNKGVSLINSAKINLSRPADKSEPNQLGVWLFALVICVISLIFYFFSLDLALIFLGAFIFAAVIVYNKIHED